MVTLGQQLKIQRKALQMSQTELVNDINAKWGLSISQTQYSAWENGTYPHKRHRDILSQYFEIDLDQFPHGAGSEFDAKDELEQAITLLEHIKANVKQELSQDERRLLRAYRENDTKALLFFIANTKGEK